MNTKLCCGANGLALLAGMLAAAPAGATVTISSATTQNMSCSGGVCSPTVADATLNVTDLENLLASGNVEVTTTGSGVQANDIEVKAGLTWSNSSALALDANRSLFVEKPVSVDGNGGLAVNFNTGNVNGDLYFEKKGNVTFADLSGSLTINGSAYTLENTIQGLAAAIADNPSGNYALASSFDAKQNGTYTSYPIPTWFSGAFEGFGNEISRLKITSSDGGGLFIGFEQGSVIRDISLVSVKIKSRDVVGGLAAVDELGQILHCHVTGSITATTSHGGSFVGGLVGNNEGGTIVDSSSGVTIGGGAKTFIGGLVGLNEPLTGLGGTISESFATGSVTDQKGGNLHYLSGAGGLAGMNTGSISYSYATGSVSGENLVGNLYVGGLLGANYGTITQSYSTGAVSGGSYVGGLIGYDSAEEGSLTYTYWDTDTSGITNLSQGAGYPANDPGITGLTTEQFQSGLPDGFDPSVWNENSKINDGFPYLNSNAPQ